MSPAQLAEHHLQIILKATPPGTMPFRLCAVADGAKVTLTYGPERDPPPPLAHSEQVVYDAVVMAGRPQNYRQVHASVKAAGWPYCPGYVRQILTSLRRKGVLKNNEDRRGFFA